MSRTFVITLIVAALLGLYFYSAETRIAHQDFIGSLASRNSATEFQTALDPGQVTDPVSGSLIPMTPLHPTTGNQPKPTRDQLSEFVQHTIKRGETLASILRAYGASREQIGKLIESIQKNQRTSPVLHAGQKLHIERGTDGTLLGLTGSAGEQLLMEIARGADGGLNYGVQNRGVVENVRVVRGTINNSFAQAALDAGIPYEVIDDVVDLFGARVEFSRAIQPGDSFVVKYLDRRSFDGKELSPGYIIAASLQTAGRSLAALRYQQGTKAAQYYDENGEALGDFFLRYPLKFTRISSMFTNARFHPVLKTSRPHNGVDFAAPIGTPVRSVAAGTVVYSGWLRGGGNTVRVKHSDRWVTEYMHLNSIGKNARLGKSVGRGEVIGTVGMTGLATGPHLHFGLFDRGKYVNPLGNTAPRTGTETKMPSLQLRAMLNSLAEQHRLASSERPGCSEKDRCVG